MGNTVSEKNPSKSIGRFMRSLKKGPLLSLFGTLLSACQSTSVFRLEILPDQKDGLNIMDICPGFAKQ